METALAIMIGISLAAACGFRIFVPLLVLSAAATAGMVPLSTGFEWIGTRPAMLVFAAATVAEILAFYIPWVDTALDVAAQPLAMVAGLVVTAAVLTEMSPLWKWSLAVIAGGGIAGVLQGGTVVARGASTLTTAGLGNFAVSTVEVIGAFVTSVLAVLAPVLGAILVLGMLALTFRLVTRFRRRRASP
jgi:hypothetical protein